MRWQAGVEGRTPRRRLLGGVKPPWRRTVRGGECMPQEPRSGRLKREEGDTRRNLCHAVVLRRATKSSGGGAVETTSQGMDGS